MTCVLEPSEDAFEGMLRFIGRRAIVAKINVKSMDQLRAMIKEGYMCRVPKGARRRHGLPYIRYVLTPKGKSFVEYLENREGK